VGETERGCGGAHGVEVVGLDMNLGCDDATAVFVARAPQGIKDETGLRTGLGGEGGRRGEQRIQVRLRRHGAQALRGGSGWQVEFVQGDGVGVGCRAVLEGPGGSGRQGCGINARQRPTGIVRGLCARSRWLGGGEMPADARRSQPKGGERADDEQGF